MHARDLKDIVRFLSPEKCGKGCKETFAAASYQACSAGGSLWGANSSYTTEAPT